MHNTTSLMYVIAINRVICLGNNIVLPGISFTLHFCPILPCL
jgi:hypothetical protein